MNEDTIYFINIEGTSIEDQNLFWDSLNYHPSVYTNKRPTHIKFIGSLDTPNVINSNFRIVAFLPMRYTAKEINLDDYLTYFKLFNTPLKEYIKNKEKL